MAEASRPDGLYPPASRLPRDPAWDSTISLLREGYGFIPARCRRLGSDGFRTRLMLREATCVSGAPAAEMFYEPGRFTRRGAIPPTTLMLLQDRDSVATLDRQAHRWRKALFIEMLGPGAFDGLTAAFAEEWRAAIPAWERKGRICLFDEARALLLRAVWRWCGLQPLDRGEQDAVGLEIGEMIAAAGGIGPRTWRALLLRERCEARLRRLLQRMRDGDIEADPACPAARLAQFRGPDGELLPVKTCAVELLNILRPTVAIAYYITFAGLALHRHPEWRGRMRAGDPGADREFFVLETRRFYPFFPFVGGLALEAFSWGEQDFAKGDWVILDLHGTNHDPRLWQRPDDFNPDRFAHTPITPFNYLPQGGGDHALNHRCPGEWITNALTGKALELLAGEMTYEVPDQDLTVRLNRMPALPASRLALHRIARAA